MKLTFIGTRGYIEARTRRHRRHTSLLAGYKRKVVQIDRGEDWLGEPFEPRPDACVVTHAHPDHVGGLMEGAPCPVYCIDTAWETIRDCPIDDRMVMPLRKAVTIAGMQFEAFPVQHSTRCPAVGYRITAGKVSIFYVPDLVYIEDRKDALEGVKLYIGDGATLDTSMVRRQDGNLIGHTPVRAQLTWCGKFNVPRAIITHCGSAIVEGDERRIKKRLRDWGDERRVSVDLAYDGMTLIIR